MRDYKVAPAWHVHRPFAGSLQRRDRKGDIPFRGESRDLQKVLFVCTANICRSPMAQEIFNALAADGRLPYRAESAGTAAPEGEPMAPNSVAVLEESGIYPEMHRARQVSESMIEEATLVLVMGPRHAAALRRLAGRSSAEIRTLPEYALGVSEQEEIPDPYGLTLVAYRSVFRQLYEHVERTVGHLVDSDARSVRGRFSP